MSLDLFFTGRDNPRNVGELKPHSHPALEPMSKGLDLASSLPTASYVTLGKLPSGELFVLFSY